MSRHPSAAGVIAALASITLIGPLSIHIFLPLMPEVKRAFGIPDSLVGLAYSISLLSFASATLVYGTLSDRHGRRPVLLAGLALFCAGSAVTAIAGSIEVLLAGRVLQAFGAGCGVTLARAIARDTFGTESLVKVVAYLTMAATLGPMLTPLLGGVLCDAFGWRSVFWVCLYTGATLITAVYFVLRETRPAADLAHQAPQLWRNYAALCSQPRFCAFVLNTGFASGTFMCIATASAFLMQDYLGRSATEFGLYFLMMPAGFVFGNLVSSRLAGRLPVETMVLAGSIMQAAMVAILSALIMAGWLTPLTLFVPGALSTFAQGLSIPNAQVGAIRVNAHLAGTAAGIGVFTQFFVGAVFSQVYVLVADGTPLPLVFTASLSVALAVLTGMIPYAIKARGGEPQAGAGRDPEER